MSENDRRSRDLELLRGAVERDRQRGASKPEKSKKDGSARAGMMYRGQPVAGRGGGGRAPGAPGGGTPRPSSGGGGADDDINDTLRKLTQLFNDGLITKAEFDAKRGEILDRL